MKIKQIKKVIIVFALLILSFAGTLLASHTTNAYTCTGTTSGGAPYYYKDGRCWEPHYDSSETNATYDTKPYTNNSCPSGYEKIGNQPTCQTYLCNGVAQGSGNNKCTSYTRNESKDKPGGSAPVHNDGTPVKNFVCDNGGDVNNDCAKRTCTGGGNTGTRQTCTTTNGNLVPDGEDTTTANNPNANLNYCDKTYVSTGIDNQTANRQACIAGQQGKDCAATYAAASQASQKAACEAGAKNPSATPPINGIPGNGSTSTGDAGTCGEAKTNIITCDGEGVSALADVLKIILFVLTIIIGIVATGGIVYGAVLYASAQDNSGQVSKAKTIIRDVVIGLLLYGFMVAIVNWLIPGGVIS